MMWLELRTRDCVEEPEREVGWQGSLVEVVAGQPLGWRNRDTNSLLSQSRFRPVLGGALSAGSDMASCSRTLAGRKREGSGQERVTCDGGLHKSVTGR